MVLTDWDGSDIPTTGLPSSRVIEEVNKRFAASREQMAGSTAATYKPYQIYFLDADDWMYQQDAAGTGKAALWPLEGAPHHTHFLATSTTPFSADPKLSSNVLAIDASAGAKTVNLPNLYGKASFELTIMKADDTANAVTVHPFTGHLVAGFTGDITLSLPGDGVKLVSIGNGMGEAQWLIEWIKVAGQKTITSAASPYSIRPEDGLLLCDCSAGSIVATLPQPISGGVGSMFYPFPSIKVKLTADNAGANTLTVNPQTGQTIDGLSSGTGIVFPAVASSIGPVREFERKAAGTGWWITGSVL